ncbi:N-acetylneuraminate synthase [Leptospira kobayashii]|uniref:N-acetylneuraminate synthase n=1 Tax=Leptospira kobayashii TaxID=1917830 RepID=A0ABM7UJZ1_9LEPT|nr:N-acetylneuraminate synthase family protein [Leptospira kobayashii]BDA79203.1 N-acetylneuraminate synthase [Leptospira kobayashii]
MNHTKIKIRNQEISRYSQPYIVAEVGINHNGNLENAFKMIEVAKDAGVDAVKFQTFKAEEFVSDKTQMFTYYSQGKEVTESMLEMFLRYQFTPDEWQKIYDKCKATDITFLSTPQNLGDLELLLKLGIEAIKVGSDDFVNIPLLQDYAKKGLPLILSLGMSNLGEVYHTLESVNAFDGFPVILLLCTSLYPTQPEDVNLKKLDTLRGAFPGLILGFSDHTQGPLASSLAVAKGAVFFEKHFTLDHNMVGPDHWFSENPEGLKVWVDNIRTAYKMLGTPIVRPTEGELFNRKEFRRYIVASKEIQAGEILSEQNLTLRRVAGGAGLPASFWQHLQNAKASKKFNKGEAITL